MLEFAMLRRPLFWIIFVALSLAAAIFTFRNFSTAFPLVSIDLQMDRAQALRDARMLAEKNAWPPNGFDQAAEFGGSQEVQNFIELEGGGKPELKRILTENIFALYTWRVRHFKEGDAHETLVRFTPEGRPYGFQVKLPEGEKGESKAVDEARRIAEQTAADDWNIDLSDLSRYKLIESSKEDRPGGRTDHTFVYERQDERIRDGRYRMRLVVGGDKLTELVQFVQVPEAFARRYEEMRAANEAIGAVSSVVMIAVYILGFCGIGLFFMIRHHWLLWRQATMWGVFLGLLLGLQQLNSWPLAWMNYDTAVPASQFAIRQFMSAFTLFGAMGVLLTLSFMAAETLSRRAFPHHIQFWKIWSNPVGASKPVLGQTIGGYLLVAPFFAYEIVLYFLAQGKLGWWTPSDTLVNPNMFADYLPSLSAIAMAAQAGFWEECLFRAAPLAVAALIGDRFGKRGPFIAVAMVMQALIFAAGHAGYANQPSYARVVELIIPSFVFGAIYLMFGLLPGIVLHFAYDVVWMALPLFVSTGTRARIEQAIVIVAALVPLWVVLVRRMRKRAWSEVPGEALNAAWRPPEVVETHQPEPEPAAPATSIPAVVRRVLPIAGLAGLIAWIFASPFRSDAPPVQISRSQAEQKAREALTQRGAQLDGSWTVLSRMEGQPGPAQRFVWQTSGPDTYRKLLGVYLPPPSWVVRFARFEGDVAERAEEYFVYVSGAGQDFRVSHSLPEAKPGKNLTEEEARTLAVAAIPDRSNFKEVSAQADRRPSRTDWTFTFKDTRDYGLSQGEPRISIEIAGDEVADTAKYVFIPDDWFRTERARRTVPGILSGISVVVLVSIVVAAAVIGAVYWSRKRPFATRVFLAVFAAMFVCNVVILVNNIPVLASQASTAQPLALQLGIAIVTQIVLGGFVAGGLGLAAGLVGDRLRTTPGLRPGESILTGVSVGLAMAGMGALARQAIPSTPIWGNSGPASSFVPMLTGAVGPVSTFLTQVVVLMVVLYAIYRRPRALVAWIILGLALTGSSIETIPSWLILGVTTGLALMAAYWLVFRHAPGLILFAAATLACLSTIRDAVQGMYPGALPAAVMGALLIAGAAWIWFRGTMDSLPRRA